MFTIDEIGALFGIKPRTVLLYIKRGILRAEPILGDRRNGYMVMASASSRSLFDQGLLGQARMLERAAEVRFNTGYADRLIRADTAVSSGT